MGKKAILRQVCRKLAFFPTIISIFIFIFIFIFILFVICCGCVPNLQNSATKT